MTPSEKGPRRGRRESASADVLAASIEPIVSLLVDLQAKTRELGVFTCDRELLACSNCGLLEDVLADGRLITCREDDHRDTGLRFAEAEETSGIFICPACGSEVMPANGD